MTPEVARSRADREHYINNSQEEREAVNKAIATAVTPEDKQAIVEQEIQKVKDAEVLAQSCAKEAQPTRDSASDVVPRSKIDDAKVARRSLIRLFQIAKKSESGEVTFPPTVSLNSRKLLSSLDSKFGNNLDDSTAVILFPLITKALSHDLSADELEHEYLILKNRLDPFKLRMISDAIIEHSSDYGMNMEDAKRRFESVSEIQPVRRAPFSERERADYQRYLTAIDNYPPAGSGLSPQVKQEMKNKLWGDIFSGDRGAVKTALPGLSDTEVDDLLHISQQEGQNGGNDILDNYGIKPSDLEIFESRFIKANFGRLFIYEKGKNVLKTEEIDKMVSRIYHATNDITSRVSNNPDSDWRDNFNDMQEGVAVRELKRKLFNLMNDQQLQRMLGDEPSRYAFRDTISGIVSEIDYEISAREALHTIRKAILGGQADTNKLAEFLKSRFPASRVSLIFEGYKGKLNEVARGTSVRYVSQRLREANGLPADLFANYFNKDTRYGQPDQRNIRDDFIETLNNMRDDPELERNNKELFDQLGKNLQPWQIERAMTLGMTVSLIGDIRIIEELATAAANADFKGGLASWMGPFGYLSKILRGQRLFMTPGILYTPVPLTEKQRKAQRKHGHHNVLNKNKYFHDPGSMSSGARKAYEIMFGATDAETKYGIPFIHLIRDMVGYSYHQKLGWRLDTLKNWYKEQKNSDGDPIGELGGSPQEWRDAYTHLTRLVGAGSRWDFDKERVEDEMKYWYLTHQYGSNYKDTLSKTEIEAEWKRIKNKVKKDESVTIGPLFGKSTFEEFAIDKVRCYQGMNFQELLFRSPYDFMLNMVTLEPEIFKIIEVGSGNKKKVSAYEFYFGSFVGLNKAQQEERNMYLAKLERKWGADNVHHIARTMKLWHNVYEDIRGNEPLTDEIARKAHSYAYHIMGSAAEKVKMKNKNQMTNIDVVGTDRNQMTDIDDVEKERRIHLKELFAREFLRGPDGLQRYFLDLNEKFGDKKGQEGQLGDKKFFYTLATRWFDIEQRRIIPSTSEVRLEPYFNKIATVGEDVLSRQMEDPEGYNDILKELPNLDEMLYEYANGNKKRYMEFMQKIKSLSSKEGTEGVERLNWIFSYVLEDFFKQSPHSTRDPFYNKNKSSDSQAVFGKNAYKEASEQVRLTIQEFEKNGLLPKEGPHSAKKLMEVLGVDTKKYFINEALPMMLTIMLLWFILQQIKSAYDAEMDQKKAA